MSPLRTLIAGCLAMALVACAGPRVTLETRPTDLDTAGALARLVADIASCGSVEDYSQHSDRWDFTCQTGPGGGVGFTIRVVPSQSARRAAVRELAGFSTAPIKAGDYFLVQPGEASAQREWSVALDRFPGQLLDPTGS